jgi:hypothetical protein
MKIRAFAFSGIEQGKLGYLLLDSQKSNNFCLPATIVIHEEGERVYTESEVKAMLVDIRNAITIVGRVYDNEGIPDEYFGVKDQSIVDVAANHGIVLDPS